MQNERDTGLWSVLKSASTYRAFQSLVGAESFQRWLIKNHWKIAADTTVLDIGCGPARLRAFLPENISYFGLDPNPDYIFTARKTASGIFHMGDISTFMNEHGAVLEHGVDTIICSGVLQHLSTPQINEVLVASTRLLKPAGRFLAMEPAFTTAKTWLTRWVVSRDRGTNVQGNRTFKWLEKLTKSS